MLEFLQNDVELFLYLNQFHSPFWDVIMRAVSSLALWFPLYGFLLYVGFKKYGVFVWRLALAAGLVIALSDQVSSSIFKPKVARPRPCHQEGLNQVIHNPYGCGGRYGFVSSHAANTFGIATFIVLIWGLNRWWWLWLWSLFVSYSRIYLGVHFPFDVLGGSILGGCMAMVVYLFYFRFLLRCSFLPLKIK